MKKKSTIFLVIILLLLTPILVNIFSKVIAPDKILFIGHQIDEHRFDFTEEIKNEKKILKFEEIFDNLNFVTEEWYPEKSADLVFRIDHKDGTFTHFYKVWINDKEAIILSAFDSISSLTTIAKLSNEQINDLESIIH